MTLAALYAADRADHAAVPPVGTDAYAALRARDAVRRADAHRLLAALCAPTADDLCHAAWIFQHGDTPADAAHAFALADRARALGHGPARWLAAAAFDRERMYRGLPQRFGTQIVPDGRGQRLWPLDGTATDADRAAHDVPPLDALRVRAATLDAPQPPRDGAPGWLRDALDRWAREG